MATEVNPDRGQIALDALAAFVKTHEQRPLAAATGARAELPRESRLGGAGRTGDQRAAAAEHAVAQHPVESREAGGHSFHHCVWKHFRLAGSRHVHAVRAEAQWELSGREIRAAIFRDLQ